MRLALAIPLTRIRPQTACEDGESKGDALGYLI